MIIMIKTNKMLMTLMKMMQIIKNIRQIKKDTGDKEVSNEKLDKTIHNKPFDNLYILYLNYETERDSL